ncbi:MAG: DUF2202 domain-containing protein [Deferribacteres bacterium]|nr:DUF2202 domain-containing protein [candidate division KSB1 bacterium]MCB9500702.1 DUF2202 domain-containing protein [Deferribacteres bacterium]
MKTTNRISRTVVAGLVLGLFATIGCDSATAPNEELTTLNTLVSATEINEFPYEDLTPEETEALVFMREEEKLARDVYIALYPTLGQRVFNNISASEQRHMDAIKLLVDKYELEDPVAVDSVGVFQNETLQSLYVALVAQGSASLEEGLKVGALIEEIDILDLQHDIDDVVDNEDITYVYNNLMHGSYNHLRAFVRNLSRLGVEYVSQKLSQDVYDAIMAGEL